MTLDTTIKSEISRFSVADSAIAEITAQYSCLAITDVEDKAQYQVVHNARMHLRDVRVSIEKTRKEANADYVAIKKAIDDEAKRITAPLELIEQRLKVEEDKVEAHRESIRMEKARKAQEKLQDRVNKMNAVRGCSDITIISALSDDDFESELAKATTADETRKQEEEKERVRIAEEKVAQETERKRIIAETADLQKQKDELALAQKKMDDDKRALEEAKKIQLQAQAQLEEKIKEDMKKTETVAFPPIDESTNEAGTPTDRTLLLQYMYALK
jgi:hypothetical protein